MDMAKYIGETTEYDKKQEVERRKVKSWLKSVSAFANGVKVRVWAKSSSRLRLFLTLKKGCFQASSPTVPSLLSHFPI